MSKAPMGGGLVVLACVACNHSAPPAPSGGSAATPRSTAPATADTPAPADAPAAAGPPPLERGCSRDSDCAVARIEVAGPGACCDACVTTPGTALWHSQLQRYCGAHPNRTCGALACPEGPTRAICRAGRCEATATDDNGKPVRVAVERRCLPAIVCTGWVGCVAVRGNPQDGWFVDGEATALDAGARAPRGALVGVSPACTTVASDRCVAVDLAQLSRPPTAPCPPWTAPPLIAPPPYQCAEVDGACRRR